MVSSVLLCQLLKGSPGDVESLNQLLEALEQSRVLDRVAIFDAGFAHMEHLLRHRVTPVYSGPGERGESALLIAGMKELANQDYRGVLVCSPLQPVRSQALFVDVLHAFWKSRKSLVVARVQGVPQFPVILRREFLSNLSPDAGDLLSLCQHHKDELQLVDGIVEKGELAG